MTRSIRNADRLLGVGANVGNLGVRAVLLVIVVLLAVAFGLLQRHRSGRAREVTTGELLTPADLGVTALGQQATFVQFSSPVCSPCRAVRRILDDVVSGHPELRHLDVDAPSRLDLADRLAILRTPTVLVLDARGVVVRRISGLLTADQARAAVHDLVSPTPDRSGADRS